MKNIKTRIALLITILLIISSIFYIAAPIKITPRPAEINMPNEITVMMEESYRLEPEVKSDVDLGQVDIPDTKEIFGVKFKVKYKINDFTYNLTYTSSDETKASVDETGLVSPLSTGETIITVTSGEISKEIVCIVKEYIKPDTMPEEIVVLIDKSVQSISDIGDYQILNTEFQIENSDIAMIDSSGIISGIKQGTTELKTVLSNGETAITIIKVLQPLLDIEVTDKTVNVGSTVKLNVKLLPEVADFGIGLSYTSSDISVVVVNEKGIITGKKAGSSTITVKSENGVERTFTVTVKKVVAPPVSQKQNSTSTSGNTSSNVSSSTNTSGNQVSTGPNILSDDEIAQIVVAGNTELQNKGRYWADCNSYSYNDNIGTNGMSYDQAYNRVMAKVNAIYPGAMVGRVFNNGSTIIVACTTTF